MNPKKHPAGLMPFPFSHGPQRLGRAQRGRFWFMVPLLIACSATNTFGQAGCVPVPSGIVGWWPGNGNAVDIAGGNNGTLEGGASFAPGEVGQAFSLNGASQFVQIADAPSLRPSSLTLECWFNASNTTGALLCKPLGGGSADAFAFWLQGGSLNGKICNNSAEGTAVSYGFTPVPGVWHHAAYTLDNGNQIQTLYLDGVAVATNSPGISIGYDGDPLLIGADNDGGATVLAFTGEIDEPSLYDRALSAREIAAIYNAGSAGKCTDALAPVIVTQPTNQYVLAGTAVQINVTATGAAPVACQWLLNGTPLSDGGEISGSATANLVLSNTTTNDTGGYFVSITNAFGSVTSAVATLSVFSPLDPIVRNGSFEQPVLPANSFLYEGRTGVPDWSFYDGGLISPTSGFNAPPAPDGSQVAFLQAAAASFSETIVLPTNGLYTLAYFVAGRPNGGNVTYSVWLDSSLLVSSATTFGGEPFTRQSATFAATAGSHLLWFTNSPDITGDNTAFFDGIQIVQGTNTTGLPAIYWTGNGDGSSWSNPQNWDRLVLPGTGDNVFITEGAGSNVVIASAVSVASILCNKPLTIANGSLAVTTGASSVPGALTVGAGASLSASGSGTKLSSGSLVIADGAYFSVSGGAVATLPGLQNVNLECSAWNVSGAGSLLDLPAVTNLNGGGFECGPTIAATAGGQIAATNLAGIVVTTGEFGEGVTVYADATNSLIDFSGLRSVSGNAGVAINASNGGEVRVPALIGGPNLYVSVNPGSTLVVAQMQQLGGITVTGGTVSFPALINFDGGSLNLSGGAVVTLPALQNVNLGCAGWNVSGAGSLLDLPTVTNLNGGGFECGPTIAATAGGQIAATNLAGIVVTTGEFGEGVTVVADGTNSLIDFSGLHSVSGNAGMAINASHGGEVRVPALVGGPNLYVSVNPGSTLAVAQMQQLGGITVTGGTVSFPALINFDDGSLNLSGGAVVTLPVLQNVNLGCAGWNVSGAGSLLDLPTVTNLNGGGFECGPTIAATAGGQIAATKLAGIEVTTREFGEGVTVVADGTNSLIDFSGLQSVSGNAGVTINASNGGEVRVPALIGGPNLYVTVNPGSTLAVAQMQQLGGITVTGGTVSFPALINFNDGNITVGGGAVVTLPALQNYTKNCNGANWTVSGAGSVLNLPGLTNLTGAACNNPVIQAESGGQILAANLANILAGPLAFQADGTNSLIDLIGLTACSGQAGYYVTFEASSGGTLLLPNVAGDPLVEIIVNPGGIVVSSESPAITWASPAAILYGTALGTNQLDATAGIPGSFAYNPPLGAVLNAGNDALSVVFTPRDTNGYTIASTSVGLMVTPAPLSVTAHNVTRPAGQANPTFTGTIAGLLNGDTITAGYNCSAVSFSPPGVYPIVPVLVDPNNRLGNYTVLSTNGTLTVTAGPPPTFAAINPNIGVTNGGTAVTITGTGFELGAGVSIGGQAASNVVVKNGNQITAVAPPGSLGTTNVVVSNPDGTSAMLTNAYTYTGTPPSFLSQPGGLLLVAGSNAVFSVNALYAVGYQWRFNGGNLTDNGRITGSHSPVLTIPSAQAGDIGVYQVIITNIWGAAISTPASLAIIVPPGIAIPPPSQSVGIGGTAAFTVGVNGTAPFTYQWLLGGAPLTGATNAVLSLPNVQTSNQGQQYSVVVGNPAGSATSTAATLTVLNYCASAQPGQAVYPMGSPVPVTVRTFNCSSQAPAPNSSATIWISTAGTTRSLPATTGAPGTTTVNFAPLATETGTYQVAAALPGQSVPAVQSTFTLVGMSLSRNNIAAVLTPGVPVTNDISLNNLTGVALTGLSASVAGSEPAVQVTIGVPGGLAGNATGTLTLMLQAPGNTAIQDQFNVQITTAQGTTNLVSVTAKVVPPAPQLVALPASLNGTMVGGGQTLINFLVANTGGATSGPVQVLLPPATWLTTVTPLPLPPIAPGQSNQVTLALTPATSLALGAYPGTLELTSSNANTTVPFQFDCVSDLKGALLVTVQDELSSYGAGAPNVSNATITVTDFLTGSNVASAVTGTSGRVLFPNVTSAYYDVAVTAPDHGSFNTTLLLAANQTNDLTAFLDLNLVDYTWIVTPTTVPDHYTFTLDTTFATEVPWPVVTINPDAIDLCSIQGQSTQIDLTITNSGLIAAQGLDLYFGTHPDWSLVPLATNLGDLLPESSVVVPVTITRLGASTDVPHSIPAQLSYHIYTPTQTNNTVVPIYVYDANPLDCEPQNPTFAPVPLVTGGGGAFVIPPSYTVQTPQALVEVKLQIVQSAVIAAHAFDASLQLVNNAGGTISNLSINLTVYDASNHPANSLFGIPAPVLNGLNAVDGTGVLANGATGSAAWTIVPTTNAAPVTATPFAVGGSFSYVLNGEPVTVPLYAVPVTVLPTPVLEVDYFLQHDVYSQDPFTNVVEASIPFALGLLVHNLGYGDANDFTITSAQPQIIQNLNDLLITFQLIASQAGTNQSLSPSFTLDFGDLGPQSTADGLWYLTSTLEGQFIAFAATYQQVDDFGNTNTSVINRVQIHELNHVVELTVPADDHLPDYLVNDTTNVDALPEVVYSSDGTTNPVTSFTNGVTAGVPSIVNSNITVTVPATAGWGYFEVVDPGAGVYPIASITRSDGVNLLVGPNVWQTPARLHMVPPKPDNLIHIFDYNSTGSYTVTFGLPILAPSVTTLNALNVTPQTATLNAIANPNGANTDVYFQWGVTTNYGSSTAATTLTQSLYDAQAVALAVGDLPPNSTTHFRAVAVNSAGTTLGADLTLVTPPLPPPAFVQVTNRAIVDGQALVISNAVVVSTPPASFSLAASDPEGATISTNGVFRWTPACLQGSSTNLITIWVTDSSRPPLSNSMTFSVVVGECVQLGLGSTVMQVGTTSGVPVTLVSSLELTNVNWTLSNPSGRFTNWVFASSNATVAGVNSSQTFFNLNAVPGQTLQTPSLLGTIYFEALPGPSAVLSLVATNILGTALGGSVEGNIASDPARVIVIGAQPLLQPMVGSSSTRLLILYDNPGTNYQLMVSTNLASTNWLNGGSGMVTNLMEYIPVNPTAPVIFYRAQ